MSYEKYMLTRESESVTLDLPYEEGEEEIKVVIRPLSWAKKNSLGGALEKLVPSAVDDDLAETTENLV